MSEPNSLGYEGMLPHTRIEHAASLLAKWEGEMADASALATKGAEAGHLGIKVALEMLPGTAALAMAHVAIAQAQMVGAQRR